MCDVQGMQHAWQKIKLSLCLTNKALRHEDLWGSGCTNQRPLDLGTSWRLVITFTRRPLYSRGKSPWYWLDKRHGGPQSRPGICRRKKNLALTRTWNQTPSAVSFYTDCAILAPGTCGKMKNSYNNLVRTFERQLKLLLSEKWYRAVC
jgi:hypothetical protein